MSQTDSIHESFYDLFNQRFRRIDNPDGATFFANIAIGAHTKPCCVNPKFQCVIVIKQSEVERTPAPFLNRFEKYSLTYGGLLKTLLQKLPPCISITIQFAAEKVSMRYCIIDLLSRELVFLTTNDCKPIIRLTFTMPLPASVLETGRFTRRVIIAWLCLGLAVEVTQSEHSVQFLIGVNGPRKYSSQFVGPPIPVFKADFSARAGYHC